MTANNLQTAYRTLRDLLEAETAIADPSASAEEGDAACRRLVDLLGATADLEPTDSITAIVKVWACLMEAEIAFGTDSSINFAEARNTLLNKVHPSILTIAMNSWEYFDLDGAIFRRPVGGRGVTHVFRETTRSWTLYTGQDRIKPIFFGDHCEDPLAGLEVC